MSYTEDEYLLMSGIQHFVFCRRQWALIHIEQLWQENVRTVEGNRMHEKAHGNLLYEKRGDMLIVRGLAVSSSALRIVGACDVVEFQRDETGVSLFGRKGKYLPKPIEYKRGKPKTHHADLLQLCAQAICLEEKLVCSIEKGYLFYGETNHRFEVVFSNELRDELKSITQEMHALYRHNHTPKVKPGSFCRACSLSDLCLPKLCKPLSVEEYISARIKEDA